MVSNCVPTPLSFEKGEKVLCYEPDSSKAKVLYDSKILSTYETKDKRGRRIMQYKVHFQGWSSSWDRKVSAEFLLKDTEENRQLQRELAEKAQLQLGAYLYRKEHKSKKRSRKTAHLNSDDSGDPCPSPSKMRSRGISEDNISSSGSTFEKHDRFSNKGDCDSDSCSESVESYQDEDRVVLRLSERLRQYMEYDNDMVVQYKKRHLLPARMTVVTILENFVKQTALKMVLTANHPDGSARRRAATQRSAEKKEKDVDKIITIIDLLKEVADGLRIYFDFTVADYLLYQEEREYVMTYLSKDYLKNFTFIPAPAHCPDWFTVRPDISDIFLNTAPSTSANAQIQSLYNIDPGFDIQLAASFFGPDAIASFFDEQPRRKLRSHRGDEFDFPIDNCLSSIASTSSGASTPMNPNIPASSNYYLKALAPISPHMRDFLQGVLAWRIIPANAPAAPSMIFGAPHLARLLVKLPEFLNASTMSDEKLKALLQHLDTFINYLESHKDWFNEDNYANDEQQRYTSPIYDQPAPVSDDLEASLLNEDDSLDCATQTTSQLRALSSATSSLNVMDGVLASF